MFNVIKVKNVEVGLNAVIKPKLVIETELSIDVGIAESSIDVEIAESSMNVEIVKLSMNVEIAESSMDVKITKLSMNIETADDDAIKIGFTTPDREDVLDILSLLLFFPLSFLSPFPSMPVTVLLLRLILFPELSLPGKPGVK